jgi:ribonucleotide reductase alpha subunit
MYAWKSGLKTGMYYLRTRPVVDAIKFTLDVEELLKSVGNIESQELNMNINK